MQRGISKTNQNRAVQQEALRERLVAGGHIQHVIEIANDLHDLDKTLENIDITRLKAAADIKLKLIDKYLASVKAIELTGTDGAPLMTGMTVEFVNADSLKV